MVSEFRKRKLEARRKRRQLFRSLDLAARAVCNSYEAFFKTLGVYEKKLGDMREYTVEMPGLLDAAAPPSLKGKNRESAQLVQTEDFKAAKGIMLDCGKFFTATRKNIERRLKYPNWKIESRIYNTLPVNSHSISRLKWLAHECDRSIPEITKKYREAFEALGQRSKELPISLSEYLHKISHYEEACKGLDKEHIRALTRRTFTKLKNKYALSVVARNPK